jgi:hypothetical protein
MLFDGVCASCARRRGPFYVFHKSRKARRNFDEIGIDGLIAVCENCKDEFGGNAVNEMDFYLKPDQQKQVELMLCKGFPIREVARSLGHGIRTVKKLHERLGFTIKCPCGRESTHRGWCHIRVLRSPSRLAFLSRWLGLNSPDELYKPKPKPVPRYERAEIPYERETELPMLLGRGVVSMDAETGEDEDTTLHSRISSDGNLVNFGCARSFDHAAEYRLECFAETLSPRMREVLWDVDSATDTERESLLAEADLFKLRDYITS